MHNIYYYAEAANSGGRGNVLHRVKREGEMSEVANVQLWGISGSPSARKCAYPGTSNIILEKGAKVKICYLKPMAHAFVGQFGQRPH